MRKTLTIILSIACFLLYAGSMAFGQSAELNRYKVIWNSQSLNSSESMPCGGGEIALNIWTENGEILFYLSRSGAFDENNVSQKVGRVKLKHAPTHTHIPMQ